MIDSLKLKVFKLINKHKKNIDTQLADILTNIIDGEFNIAREKTISLLSSNYINLSKITIKIKQNKKDKKGLKK